jgi:hypothetical protein
MIVHFLRVIFAQVQRRLQILDDPGGLFAAGAPVKNSFAVISDALHDGG